MSSSSLVLLFVLSLFVIESLAKDLGVVGPVYPIREPDLLQEIQSILTAKEKSGEIARLQREAAERVRRSVQEPAPVSSVSRTSAPRTFYFDPSFIASRDIRDGRGQLIVKAGTRKNPLDVVSMSKHLLFFDARDKQQVELARRLTDHYGGRVKLILVAGSYLDLMKSWKTWVYYDQNGALVRKLGITQVPALVSQDKDRLRIDELVVQ